MKLKLLILVLFCLLITNSYADWVKINSYPTTLVRDILISGNVIYTASSSGVHKSTNGTLTWQQVNNGLSGQYSTDCSQIILFNNNLYLSTVEGIYKSTNSGGNWDKKSNGIIIGSGALYEGCESIFESGGVLYTGSWTGIYRSTNLGETWNQTNISGTGIKARYFINYNGTLFAARESNNPPGSWKSTDNGLTWNPFPIWLSLPSYDNLF